MGYSVAQEDSLKFVESNTYRLTRVRASRLNNTIFCALLALIALAAIPYGIVQQQWEAVFECAVFALVALCIVEGLLTGVWQVSGHRMLLPLLGLIGFALAQTVIPWGTSMTAGIEVRRTISSAPYETRLFVLKLLALTLTLALLMRYTSSQRRLRALVYLVIGVGVASAVFAFVRQTSQNPDTTFVLHYLKAGIGYGQFINRNHFAYLMEMSLGLTLGLVLGGGARRDRLLIFMAAIASLWTTLVLSNSRGGLLGMLSQLVFVALLYMTVRPRQEFPATGTLGWLRRLGSPLAVRVALILCLLVVVTVGVVWVGGDSLVSRLEVVPGEISTESEDMRQGERRLEIWRATWKLIKGHPLAGVGFGGYATAISKYHDASGEMMPEQAHNDYLELFASGGLIGLALVGWFFVTLIRPVRERLRSSDAFRRAVCFGALAGMFGIAIHSLIDFGLHVTVNALILIALVVIAVIDVEEANDAQPAHRHRRKRSLNTVD